MTHNLPLPEGIACPLALLKEAFDRLETAMANYTL